MTSYELLMAAKSLSVEQADKLAAQILIIHHPKFHGTKTIHYADGTPKKLLDNVSRDL